MQFAHSLTKLLRSAVFFRLIEAGISKTEHLTPKREEEECEVLILGWVASCEAELIPNHRQETHLMTFKSQQEITLTSTIKAAFMRGKARNRLTGRL